MNYLADYHTHSRFSFDSVQTIENAVNSAVLHGMNEICFTEHISFDPNDTSYNVFKFEDYENEIDRVSSLYNKKIKIKKGIEAGEYNLYKSDFDNYYKNNNLDFVIGSIHNIGGKGLRTNLRENGDIITYKKYFEEVLELAKKGDFDVIGHLDLPQRYAFDKFGLYNFDIYKEYIYEILKAVIHSGKGIEVNTSGLSKKLLFPSIDILKMYKYLNGELITVGSDAHTSNRVGENISYSYNLLKDIGFKYVFTFDKRKAKGNIIL